VAWPSWEETSVIERHLRICANEGARLWDVPRGVVDHYGDGRIFHWPSQDPGECSAILVKWLDEGRVTVLRSVGTGYEDLSDEEVRGVLGDPARWTAESGYEVYLKDEWR
jgi:hypothetical protein